MRPLPSHGKTKRRQEGKDGALAPGGETTGLPRPGGGHPRCPRARGRNVPFSLYNVSFTAVPSRPGAQHLAAQEGETPGRGAFAPRGATLLPTAALMANRNDTRYPLS